MISQLLTMPQMAGADKPSEWTIKNIVSKLRQFVPTEIVLSDRRLFRPKNLADWAIDLMGRTNHATSSFTVVTEII